MQDSSTVQDPCGVTEIAERTRRSVSAVRLWLLDPEWPAPVRTRRNGWREWEWAHVRAWLDTHRSDVEHD